MRSKACWPESERGSWPRRLRLCEALAAIERHQPQLLTLEPTRSRESPGGVEVIRRAKAIVPSMRAIVLSAHHDTSHIDGALAAGAAAHVVKTAHPDDVASAVRQAFDHSIYLAARPRRPPARAPRRARRAHPARARDPPTRRRRPLERLARSHTVGDRADGEVPPLEHLPEARGLEPHRGEQVGAAERAAHVDVRLPMAKVSAPRRATMSLARPG